MKRITWQNTFNADLAYARESLPTAARIAVGTGYQFMAFNGWVYQLAGGGLLDITIERTGHATGELDKGFLLMPKSFRPEIHHKGWGWEEWIWNKDYCGKRLVFYKGKRCSFHYHRKKDEAFYVQRGKVHVYLSPDDSKGDDFLTLLPGDCLHVPPGLRHQIEAVEDSVIIEFSTHHDEADSFRVIKGD